VRKRDTGRSLRPPSPSTMLSLVRVVPGVFSPPSYFCSSQTRRKTSLTHYPFSWFPPKPLTDQAEQCPPLPGFKL